MEEGSSGNKKSHSILTMIRRKMMNMNAMKVRLKYKNKVVNWRYIKLFNLVQCRSHRHNHPDKMLVTRGHFHFTNRIKSIRQRLWNIKRHFKHISKSKLLQHRTMNLNNDAKEPDSKWVYERRKIYKRYSKESDTHGKTVDISLQKYVWKKWNR